MISDFSLDNPVACKVISNQILNKNISHAYIVETNNYYRSMEFVMAFAKAILCPNNYVNKANCEDCDICTQINDNSCTELEIIQPDGMWIKKEQLNSLQKNFSTKSLNTTNKVYIITEAEKMNEASANSILKFLEEPEDNIVAILVVNSAENLLDTISSRCQKIKLKNKKNIIGSNDLERLINYMFDDKDKILELIESEQFKNLFDSSKKFLNSIESNKKETIEKENSICSIILKDKIMFQYFLKILIVFYNDALNLEVSKKEKIIVDDINFIKNITKKNNIEDISKKILLILEMEERLKYNCNLNLILDKLILKLEGE